MITLKTNLTDDQHAYLKKLAREKCRTGNYMIEIKCTGWYVFQKVRKMHKEEKKVDPIEEVYNDDINRNDTMSIHEGNMLARYREAARQHMEDKTNEK